MNDIGVFSFVNKYCGQFFVNARSVRAICAAASEHNGRTAVFLEDNDEPFYSTEPVEEVAQRWMLSLVHSTKNCDDQ